MQRSDRVRRCRVLDGRTALWIAAMTGVDIYRITVTTMLGYTYECDVWFTEDIYVGNFEVADGCTPL